MSGSPSPAGQGGGAFVLSAMTVVTGLVSTSMYIVPVLGPTMAPAFGVSPLAVGHYVSLIFAGSIFGGALGGDFVMRYGPVRVHQAALVACMLGMLLLLAGSPWLGVASGLLVGVGSGATTPAAGQMLRRTTPMDRMNLAFSIRQTGVPLGGVLAGLAAPVLESQLGWRGALIALVVVSVPVALLLQSIRAALDDERSGTHVVGLSSLTDMPAAVRAAPGLGTLAIISLGLAAAQMSLTSYFVTYLHARFDYTLVAAGALLSVVQMAGLGARLACGYAADRWFGAPRLLLGLALSTGVLFIAVGLLGTGTPAFVLTLLAAGLGACAMGWNGVYLSEVARRAPPGTGARTMSAIIPFTFGGALVGPPLFSAVAAGTGSYGAGFIAVSLMPLAGAAVMFRRWALFR